MASASAKRLVVAGGGVVGLAIARAAARSGLQVLLLEQNARVGMETSARNSEVIHAGIYYRKDSLKARLCVQGREQLYAFCDAYNVPHRKCGKLIVAASAAQSAQLQHIAQCAAANGVHDLQRLSQHEARAMEPNVHCHEALYSPSTGIIDSHALMLALQGDAEAHGAVVALHARVDSGVYGTHDRTFTLEATQDGEQIDVACDLFVNATGLLAPQLLDQITVRSAGTSKSAALTTTADARPSLPQAFAKGTYFKLRESNRPFRGLVYPLPEPGGLGVHATVDMTGNVRFGPDVEWVDAIDYVPDPMKATAFADRIRSYWPDVTVDDLVADYCGVRPKIHVHGVLYDDFYIESKATHAIPGLVHLCGIESPGLTASLAIADHVLQQLID